MKRILLLAIMAISLITSAMAERIGTMKIRGVDCQYDTLIHRHIGPGVTYTQFQFDNMQIGGNIPYKMRTHLVKIDMTNQYNRISPYMSEGRYFDCATQEQEYKRQRNLGLKPFASSNAIDFIQSPPSNEEPYQYMETRYNLVGNGYIWYEDDVNRIRYYTDATKSGNVGSLMMKAKVTAANGTSAEIGQINHYRDYVRGTNKLALFCNGMDKARDTWRYEGVEVFLEGGDINVGTNTLKVVRKKSFCGDPIEKGQCVITGVGAEVEAFLNSLVEEEAVTIEVGYIDASGNSVVPTDTYTAFIPNCVKNGVPYGDPRTNVAYTATGVSKDGKTVYLADFEISTFSNAPLRCLEDFLIEVGAWNATYNDGGPSAEMAVDGKFVTNNSIGSGFNGRYCANGIMVYSTAPDDDQIVTVECADPSMKKMSIGESFALEIFGFNQYGEMIDNQAINNAAVEISCTSEIGTINDGVFTATTAGVGVITVGVKNHGTQIQIPVNVGNQTGLIITPNSVFTGEDRPVQLSVKYIFGEEVSNVDPSQVSWSVDDSNIVSSCNNGLVKPFMDGHATITASYKGVTATVGVDVENLEEAGTAYVELTDKVLSASDINLQLPSVPHSIYIETSPVDNGTITLKYTTGTTEVEKVLENKGVGMINRETITLDYDAADTYPVVVKSVSPAATVIKRLIAVYTGLPSGINDLYNDETSHFEFSRSGESLTLINCSSATDVLISVYSFNGTKLAEKQVYLPEAESCTLDVKLNEPVIVRVQTKNGVQVFKLAGE